MVRIVGSASGQYATRPPNDPVTLLDCTTADHLVSTSAGSSRDNWMDSVARFAVLWIVKIRKMSDNKDVKSPGKSK